MMIFYLILSILVFQEGFDSSGWKKVKDKDNIKVFARKLEETGLKEIKVTGVVTCQLSEIVAALEDVNQHTDWVLRTTESKILTQRNEADFDYYVLVDMPFPVKDRDIVLKYHRSFDPSNKRAIIQSEALISEHPVHEKSVRIENYVSKYTLTQIAEKSVALDYSLQVDPAGKLPKWLVNMAAATGPYKTIRGLFDLVESGKYSK